MAPRNKDPTNAQLSSRLRYDQGEAPAFLTRMRAQVSGHGSRDEDEPSYDNYEDYADFQGRRRDDDGDDDEDNGGEGGRGGGRVPIPRRPPVPSRPGGTGSDNEGGGALEDGKGELDEEDADDEAPQVVVLKQGKHLSEQEVDNEKRKAKGLSPLPEAELKTTAAKSKGNDIGNASAKVLSALQGSVSTTTKSSSGVTIGSQKKSTKRKVIGSGDDDGPTADGKSIVPVKGDKKKAKKQKKTLLSFGDEA